MKARTVKQTSGPERELLPDWTAVKDAFDSFPHPKLGFDLDGELNEDLWVFRGHRSTAFRLEPSIEREASGKLLSWTALELKILEEFKSRARMHLSPSDVPEPNEKLSWLALMQHYGVPTRLLDFTFSPYVALYFALRGRAPTEQNDTAEVWAVDARALMEGSRSRSRSADKEESDYERRRSGIDVTFSAASLDPRFSATDRDLLEGESASLSKIVSNALSVGGIRRSCFNEHGFVALAMPPTHNRRLASQQGVFLFSGAEDLSFQDSMFRMMSENKQNWCRRFEISAKNSLEIERRLFQMNIHELSLFPDMEGLAGFIRQKARLHWWPADRPLISQPPEPKTQLTEDEIESLGL